MGRLCQQSPLTPHSLFFRLSIYLPLSSPDGPSAPLTLTLTLTLALPPPESINFTGAGNEPRCSAGETGDLGSGGGGGSIEEKNFITRAFFFFSFLDGDEKIDSLRM